MRREARRVRHGIPALRTPRSSARAMSLWLAKRIRPRLAYLITRR